MPMADAIALALSIQPHDTVAPEPVAVDGQMIALTRRERTVLVLVARGKSDREIAEALSISPRTVGGHISNLLGKLGVESRTAAATFALQHDLISAEVHDRSDSAWRPGLIDKLRSQSE
jgi:DNA-binding NarL/FixJ family response regulator